MTIRVNTILFLFCFLAPSLLFSAPLRLVTAEEPPNNFSEDGQIKGIAVDVVNAMVKESGLEVSHHIYPWKRSYEMLKNETNIGVYSTTRTPERENKFQWVGPLVGKTFGLFQHKQARFSAKSIDTVKSSYLVLSQLASWQHDYLLSNQFKNISTHQSHEKMAHLMKHHRGDYWFVGDLDMIVATRENNISPSLFKLAYPIREGANYIAFSKDVPQNTIQQLQDALKKIKTSGQMDEIAKKWSEILGIQLEASSKRGIIVKQDAHE